jgi:hypothetical protein
MKNDSPAISRVKLMKTSLRCLVFGLLGLLPLIGLPFALAALWFSYSARRWEVMFWNPAKPHRILGLLCASVGAFVWGVVDTIIIYHAFNNYGN